MDIVLEKSVLLPHERLLGRVRHALARDDVVLKSFELQLVRSIYLSDGKSEFRKEEILLREKLFAFCPTEDVTFDLDLARCRRERDEGDLLAPSCYGKSVRIEYRLRLAEVNFAALCVGAK